VARSRAWHAVQILHIQKKNQEEAVRSCTACLLSVPTEQCVAKSAVPHPVKRVSYLKDGRRPELSRRKEEAGLLSGEEVRNRKLPYVLVLRCGFSRVLRASFLLRCGSRVLRAAFFRPASAPKNIIKRKLLVSSFKEAAFSLT
jgi:hypothetical protein